MRISETAVGMAAMLVLACTCMAGDPVVSNVRASQRGGGSKLVDIYYDVADTDGDRLTVSAAITDNGVPVPATSLTGAIGANVVPGSGKQIVWDAGADWAGQFSQSVRVAITAEAKAGSIFSDDFNDNSISSGKWTTWGTLVTENEAIMQVLQNQTDAGGNLRSLPIRINPAAPITITRTTRVHYANDYFMGSLHLTFGALPRVSIRYGNMSYNGTPHQSVYGFFISRNDASPHSRSTEPSDISARIAPIWDTWFAERVIYNPRSGDLQYYINDVLQTTFNVGQMPETAAPTLTIQCDSWGWWTGHQHQMDDLLVTQDHDRGIAPARVRP